MFAPLLKSVSNILNSAGDINESIRHQCNSTLHYEFCLRFEAASNNSAMNSVAGKDFAVYQYVSPYQALKSGCRLLI
nr:CFF_HP1_G0040720.mRNA.1.CDS.1 [Saccharomyces cerevisiae]